MASSLLSEGSRSAIEAPTSMRLVTPSRSQGSTVVRNSNVVDELGESGNSLQTIWLVDVLSLRIGNYSGTTLGLN